MQVSKSSELDTILEGAAGLGARRGQPFVGVEHLFEAIVEHIDLLPRSFVERHHQTLNIVAHELQREKWRGIIPPTDQDFFYTPRCAHAFHEASRLARLLKHKEACAYHLFLALLSDNLGAPARVLDRLQLGRPELIRELWETVRQKPAVQAAERKESDQEGSKPSQGKAGKERAQDPLTVLSRDLTAAAKAGGLPPVIGRDGEIQQVLQILSRNNKNNVMLVGKTGVGKSRVVEGVALAAVGDEASNRYRFLDVNLAAVKANPEFRRAFTKRVPELLEALKHTRNTILHIEGLDCLTGLSSTDDDMRDLTNQLLPVLTKGEIRCIGSTTLEHYRRLNEQAPELDRHFQMVRIEPLSPAATWEMLNGMRPSLEKHHKVRITRKALHAALALTQRYMPDRHFPDKAIEVVDQASVRHRLYTVAFKNRPEMFDRGADDDESATVTPHDIRKVVSQLTGIPLDEITTEERRRLEDLDSRFKERIIGQDEAVNRVVAVTKKSRASLSDSSRPEATMLFVGPHGVGKSQTAKVLADLVFGSENHLVTIDMKEYADPATVARLVGESGSGAEGRLTAAVRSRPFSVLVFNNIESAHPKVFDALLKILGEGCLKDSVGQTVSFRNCMIVFILNAGADLLNQGEDPNSETSVLIKSLYEQFRPEFINRIDEIVPFYPLLFEDIRTILVNIVNDFTSRLRGRQIDVYVFQRVLNYLAEEGYSQSHGARELRATVERLVFNPINAMVAEGQFEPGDTIEVLMDNDQLLYRRRKVGSPVGTSPS